VQLAKQGRHQVCKSEVESSGGWCGEGSPLPTVGSMGREKLEANPTGQQTVT